jgi:carboxyl-terminal processing protease
VLERVRRDYVDRVDDQELIEAAIRGMVADLDPIRPFSARRNSRTSASAPAASTPASASRSAPRTAGSLSSHPSTTARRARAGIVAGDVIASVDGIEVDAGQLEDTVGRMRGPAGTKVVLGILREGAEAPLEFELWARPGRGAQRARGAPRAGLRLPANHPFQ